MSKPRHKQSRPAREGRKILSRLRTLAQEIEAFEEWQREQNTIQAEQRDQVKNLNLESEIQK